MRRKHLNSTECPDSLADRIEGHRGMIATIAASAMFLGLCAGYWDGSESQFQRVPGQLQARADIVPSGHDRSIRYDGTELAPQRAHLPSTAIGHETTRPAELIKADPPVKAKPPVEAEPPVKAEPPVEAEPSVEAEPPVRSRM